MSIAYIPYRHDDGEALDVEELNANLRKLASDIKREMDARYTYSVIDFSLDGMTDADNAAARKFYIRRPASGYAAEIIGFELVIYGDGNGDVWTATPSVTSSPAVSLTTVTTTEVTVTSGVPFPIESSSSDTTITLSCPTTSTITAGKLIVHIKTDRWSQGTARVDYEPGYLSAAQAPTATAVNTEITAASTAAALNSTKDEKLHCVCFSVRSLAAAGARTFRVPVIPTADGLTWIGAQAYALYGTGTATADVSISWLGSATTEPVASGTSAGAGTLATGGTFNDAAAVFLGTPTDSAADTTVTITNNGAGTAAFCYVIIWYR